MFTAIEDLKEAYETAISAITVLREKAEDAVSELESIVEACETLEEAL